MAIFVRRIGLVVASAAFLLAVLLFGYDLGVGATSSDKNFASIEEAWKLIHEQYVGLGSVDSNALSQAAIQAMMEVLNDAHSEYMSQSEYEEFINSLMGNSYGGIGAIIASSNGNHIVNKVYQDRPAEKAGLKVGDILLEVDGISTSGMSLSDLIDLVKGEAGTQVNLLVRHQGDSTTTLITITRENIVVPTVELKMYGDIAYLEISHFSVNTNNELGEALIEIDKEGAKGIVIDLRGNPGGFLDVAVNAISRFIKSGVVLTEQKNDGTEVSIKASIQKETTDLPVVVLVNSGSASASEVFCGALQDYGRAVIAGSTTYGKGSINQLYELPDGSAIYLTVSRWLTPNGNIIEGNGITPDYVLEKGTDWIQWAVEFLS
ncbi:MAG: S41 family peptidase [Dehalococcoidia bacterium]|nr:S41 family peptidase [Dehalococcoidia bacterium]